MVSLSYLPSAERLTVVVIKARNLRVVDDTRNSSDPYVKVSLVQAGKKIKKRKTGVYRNTVCPVFNEALTFDIGKELLRNCLIEFVVLHDSLLGKSTSQCCWIIFKLLISYNKYLLFYYRVKWGLGTISGREFSGSSSWGTSLLRGYVSQQNGNSSMDSVVRPGNPLNVL